MTEQQLAIKVRQVADSINLDDTFDSFEYLDPRLAQEFAKRLLAALPASEQKPVAFEAREIGEGVDWFRIGLDETERIERIKSYPEMDYRWLYTHPDPDSAARIKELEAENEMQRVNLELASDYQKQMFADFNVERSALKEKLRAAREAFQTFIDEHEEGTDQDGWMAQMCSMEAVHVAQEFIDESLLSIEQHFKDQYAKAIAALDAYVADLEKQRDGLVKDAERLDFMLRKWAIVVDDLDETFFVYIQSSGRRFPEAKTPRAAVDAALASVQEGGAK